MTFEDRLEQIRKENALSLDHRQALIEQVAVQSANTVATQAGLAIQELIGREDFFK